MAEAKTSPAESAAEGSPASEIAAGTDMITPEFLPGTEMTTVETLPGTAIMITLKKWLFEPVIMTAAVCPGGSIEVRTRIEVRSMETMTR